MNDKVTEINAPTSYPDLRDAPQAIDLRHETAVPQLADVDVTPELKAWIEERMTMYPDARSAAIPCLMKAQERNGWLSPEAIREVAAVMRMTPASLVSVASFYDMFNLQPRGRHTIYMCTNLSCMLRGAEEVLAALEREADVENGGTSEDGIFLRSFECLGACDIAPMASVNGNYIGPLTVEDAKALIEDLRADRDPLPAKHLSKRPVAATYWGIDEEDRETRGDSGTGSGAESKPESGPSTNGSEA